MSDVLGKEVLSSNTYLLDAHYSSKISVHSANHDLTNSIALSMSNVFDLIPTKKISLVGQDVEHHSTDYISAISSFLILILTTVFLKMFREELLVIKSKF